MEASRVNVPINSVITFYSDTKPWEIYTDTNSSNWQTVYNDGYNKVDLYNDSQTPDLASVTYPNKHKIWINPAFMFLGSWTYAYVLNGYLHFQSPNSTNQSYGTGITVYDGTTCAVKTTFTVPTDYKQFASDKTYSVTSNGQIGYIYNMPFKSFNAVSNDNWTFPYQYIRASGFTGTTTTNVKYYHTDASFVLRETNKDKYGVQFKECGPFNYSVSGGDITNNVPVNKDSDVLLLKFDLPLDTQKFYTGIDPVKNCNNFWRRIS